MKSTHTHRILSAMLVGVMSLALLTGCNQTDVGGTDYVAGTDETEVPSVVTTAPDMIETDSTEIIATEPDVTESVETESVVGLFDFEITIDGSVIQLPCNVADLTALGWTMKSEKAESVLSSGYTTGVNLYHEDGSYITVSIYNDGDEDVTFANAMVDDISIHDTLQEHQISICGGLTIGSTKSEVMAVYGNEPSREYSDDTSYSSLTYEGDSFYEKVTFSFKDDIVYEIDVCS